VCHNKAFSDRVNEGCISFSSSCQGKAKRYSINVNCSYCACARACCSSAVPTTYGALIITSPVVRKPSEISFGLALWHAGKLLQCHTNRSCETFFGETLKVSGYEMMCAKQMLSTNRLFKVAF